MNKQIFSFLSLTFFLCLLSFTANISAKEIKKEPITDTAVNLQGVSDSFTYSYYLSEDAEAGKNGLTLNVEHSTLLISPSSLTIRIDGENQKTVKLDGKKSKITVQADLKGKALKKGTHEVTVVFYGIIKQGICVENNTSGNWLRINPASYFQIQGDVVGGKITLQDYPSKFTSFQTKTDVVVPNNANVETVDAALKVVSYLKKRTTDQNTIQLVNEKDFTTRPTNKVIVGVENDFETNAIKNLFKKMNVKMPADQLQLQVAEEKINNTTRNILAITTKDKKNFNSKIEVVANQEFVSQLSGTSLAIKQVPQQTKKESGTLTFEEMGIPSFEISNTNDESAHYFYYLPQNFDEEKAITTTLNIKKSAILNPKQSELIMEVNGVPHAINLEKLVENEGFLEITVPIEKSTLKSNRLLDIQFKLNGANVNDPCTTNDQEKWLFISNESTVNFSITENEQQAITSLTSYPGIFTNGNKESYVIVENLQEVSLGDLSALYTSSALSVSAPKYTLKNLKDLKEEDLQGRNIIFVGDAGGFQQKLNDNSALKWTNNTPNFSKNGFVTETISRYATIQKNPWDESYAVLQFNRYEDGAAIMTPRFLRQLQNLAVDASIAIQNKDNEIFTNRAQYSIEEKQKEAAPKKSQSALKWSSVLMFIGLLAVIGVILYLVFKRSKKK